MNHTHYLIADEDNMVFAIVPRNPIKEGVNFNEDKVKEAIQQQFDEQVISHTIQVVEKNEQYIFHAKMEGGFKRKITINPTWEYTD